MPVPNYTPANRPLVLVVDDYADACEVWTTLLRAEGFEVLTAGNGIDALATALKEMPQVVVLDLALPGMSGVEVARALRERDDGRPLPLIALTGYSEPARVQEALDAGFNVVLTKPCEPAVLVSEIWHLLAA